MKKHLNGLVVGMLSLALVTALGGCTHKDDEGTLAVYHSAEQDDIKSFDPARAYDEISLEYVPEVYETLYQYDYLSDHYKIEPLLAADMPKFSSDKLTVTIRLKQGIKYQNDPCFKATQGKGRELVADDFVYQFKRLALPVVGDSGLWVLDGKVAGIHELHEKLMNAKKQDRAKILEEPIDGIRALDKYTLQIKLLKPYPQLLYILAMTFTAPMTHEAVEAYGDDQGSVTDHAVGTGPFVLTRWERNKELVLDRNPNFHPDFYPTEGSAEFRKRGLLADAGKTLPFIDRIVMRVLRENQPRWFGFMKGEFDKFQLQKDNFPEAIENKTELMPEMKAKGIQLDINVGVTFYYIAFNMRDQIVGKNKLLRQALSSAVNRDAWIKTFTGGTGSKQVTPLPPGVPGRPENESLKYDYDLARAKELLAKAGYPNGKGLPILNFDLRGADSLNRQFGDFFTQQWSQIGVRINAISNTFPAYLEKEKNGNLQIAYGGWTMDYPDAENVYQLFWGPNSAPGPDATNFNNPEMNELYEQLAVMEPNPKRSELIKKADAIVQEEVPWGLGYYRADYWLSQPWLLNYRGTGVIANHLKYLRIDKALKKRYLEAK